MKLFLDANVLISVLNKEYPLFTFSARILSLTQTQKYQLYTSPLALAIAFYFSSKKSGEALAKKKIARLLTHIKITTVDEMTAQKAIKDKKANDFEDGMQYYSALKANCKMILTENQRDFYFSEITVTDCEGFFRDYFKKKPSSSITFWNPQQQKNPDQEEHEQE